MVAMLATSMLGSAQAQQISGKVVDAEDNPVAYANVVMHTADSAYVAGTVTDEAGQFALAGQGNGALLHVSYIGYTPVWQALRESGTMVVRLTADNQLLDEVVVKGTLPKTQIKGDAMVTSVENSVLATLGSANDVLGKIPGVIHKGESIEVLGKGTPVVYINGRLVRDNAELEQLNSDEIKHVEVIHNPGARYDATVNAVIRIQTIRKQGDGFGFNLRSSVFQSDYNTDLIDQLSFNYRHGNLDVFGNLDYRLMNDIQEGKLTQSLQSIRLLELNNTLTATTHSQVLLPTLGANYQFNENHSMGVKYMGKALTDYRGTMDGHSKATLDGILDDDLRTQSTMLYDDYASHQVNAYYNGTAGKLNIDFNADWLMQDEDGHDMYDENSTNDEDRIVNSYSNTCNRMGAGKLVLTYPVWGGSLSAGSEYTYTYRKDVYLNPENYLPSSNSTIREQNATAFAEYSHALPFGAIGAGLRYEHVAFDYYINDAWQADQSRAFDNFFPNASLTALLGPVQAQLSYAVKTQRPSYHQLRNSVTYIDRYSLDKGNPTLRQQITHNLSLSGAWQFFQLSASYSLLKDAFVQWGTAQPENPDAMMLTTINYAKPVPQMSAFLVASPQIGCWMPSLTVGLQKQWFDMDFRGETISMNKPIWVGYLTNIIQLPKNYMIQLDMSYQGKGHTLVYETLSHNYALGLSVRKSFLNDALTIELEGTDLLDSQRAGVCLRSGDYSIVQYNHFDTRQATLTVRYKFNTTKSKYKGTGAGESAKSRM